MKISYQGKESFWVKLTYIDALDDLDDSACDALCVGVVGNVPVTTDAVRLGDQIRFVASDILQVYIYIVLQTAEDIGHGFSRRITLCDA